MKSQTFLAILSSEHLYFVVLYRPSAYSLLGSMRERTRNILGMAGREGGREGGRAEEGGREEEGGEGERRE